MNKRTNSGSDITIYRANQRHELGFIQTWLVMGRNIYRSRELIWQLFKRDFFAAYKKSFLGITWIFVTPVVGITSWVFLQKTGMLKPGDVGIPYPVYVLVGTSIWGLFIGLYEAASNTLLAGKDLILQVNYPHEALLFQQAAQQVANFSITLLLNLVVLLLFRIIPAWQTIFLPFVIIPLFLFSSGIGLVVSMINVVAIDISRAISMLLALGLYITPIIYSNEFGHELVQTMIKWNPLTYLVCSCRDLIIYGTFYSTGGYLVSSIFSFLFFMISWRLFYVSEHQLVERMI